MFVKPHSARYATPTQLLGEDELRAAAVRRGAPAWTVEAADAVIARFARAGRELGADQAVALRGILTSGAAVEVLNAPAGTGKSFLVGTLADTWPLTGAVPAGARPGGDPGLGAGQGPRVFGVAYGQRQADVLAEEGVTARNIRRWLDGQQRLDDGHGTAEDETFRLRCGDLLVVDEAGAASTPDLVALHRRAEVAGVKLLLVGDHKQLAAVGAGGALADIAERGISYELAEVRRFSQPWEAAASLRLRDGDSSVAAEYAKHGRIVDAGTVEQAEQVAARLWLADTIAGRDALLVVGSNVAAARVSNQLRGDLVRLGRVEEAGVVLAAPGWEGTIAGVGDLVQARRNAWHLQGWRGNTEAPINRQTYRVTATTADGGMMVARVTGRDPDGTEQLADPLQLPASYVRDKVTLAYASTVHAAHGRTVGHGYGVLAPGTDAAAAYVQATRSRDGNTLIVVTRHLAETAEIGETQKAARRSATQALADVIRPPEHDPNRTALTEAENVAGVARAAATYVDPLVEVIADLTAGRTGRLLDQSATSCSAIARSASAASCSARAGPATRR